MNDIGLLGPYERMVLLKMLSVAGSPPPGAIAALAQQAIERRLPAGATIRGNGAWDSSYVLHDGRVTLFRDGLARYSIGPKEACGLVELLGRASNVELRVDADAIALKCAPRRSGRRWRIISP
jgi:hypothetical protein